MQTQLRCAVQPLDNKVGDAFRLIEIQLLSRDG